MQKEEQQAQEDLTRLFPAMACGDVQELKEILNDVRHLSESKRAQYVKNRISPMLYRLKNQGALFGYPLVSDVASHFEKIIQKTSNFSTKELAIMQNDTLLLQEILWKKIKGDGGEKGGKILNQLVRIP